MLRPKPAHNRQFQRFVIMGPPRSMLGGFNFTVLSSFVTPRRKVNVTEFLFDVNRQPARIDDWFSSFHEAANCLRPRSGLARNSLVSGINGSPFRLKTRSFAGRMT